MKTVKVLMSILCGMLSFSFSAPVKTSFITIEERVAVAAAPEQVWNKLVSVEGISLVGGLTNPVGDSVFNKVGAQQRGTAMGDAGVFVVTYVKMGEEIRLSWEPDKGHYVCHASIKVKKSNEGSTVTLSESYSDEKRETVDKMAAETAKYVAASLKKFAEFAAK